MSININPITDLAALQAIVGEPGDLAREKALTRLDKHCRRFIELSPFLCLGSADAAGKADVSPRGDKPGFVRILDDRHLLIPERPGNARVDSLRNVIANPEVGLIFLIPGFEETLRVNGRAQVTADAALLASSTVDGKAPKLGLVVTVTEAFLHCAKAFRRSGLWQQEAQIARSEMPSLARIIMEQVAEKQQVAGPDAATVTTADAELEEDYRVSLY